MQHGHVLLALVPLVAERAMAPVVSACSHKSLDALLHIAGQHTWPTEAVLLCPARYA